MLKNYLLVALRNLRNNKAFSLINILGLALGMTCSMLIMLWVSDEKNKDGFHKNKERIYSIYERQYYDNKIEAFHGTPGVLPDEVKKVLPEIQYSSGMAWIEERTFQFGDKMMKMQGNHAGEDFFRMFSYRLIEGRAESALNTPDKIAISRKMAENFFGSPKAAIDKVIRFENRTDLKVSAVYENISPASSEKFDFLRSWKAYLKENQWATDWGNNGPRTYIMLRADANPAQVERKLTKFLDKYNKDQDAAFRIELGIQRADQMYLYSNFENGKISGGRIEYVRLFTAVAIFILLIACINFMNLTTARSVRRAKEIGVRKVVGAMRGVLMRQFVGEAILLSFLALIGAFVAVTLLLPAFNELTRKAIQLPFNQPGFWIGVAALATLTGLVSGSYPAFFLSSFNPIGVLKGTYKFSSGAVWFRKGLVVFQFVLSTVLIIGTIVISRQVDYAQTKNLGYDRENLIYVQLEGELAAKFDLFKELASKKAGIQSISRITQAPTQISNGTGGVEWEGKDPAVKPMFTQAGVGYDFLKTMKIELQSGRDFSKDFASDSVAYIINEAALAKIGYTDPLGKPLSFWERPGKIIGIVKNFHFNSFHEPIAPLILRFERNIWGTALIRTQPGKTKQALSSLEGVCKQLNPKFPFTYQFSDEEYQKLYMSEQVISKLAKSFAFLAIFISCLGLLGLAMFTAEQRTKEIGIRKVLGASITSVFTLLSREFIFLVSIAFMIASPLAWWLMNNWLQDFAYRIDVSWWIFLVAGLLALVIALITVSFQAIKAALANPVKSLRTE